MYCQALRISGIVWPANITTCVHTVVRQDTDPASCRRNVSCVPTVGVPSSPPMTVGGAMCCVPRGCPEYRCWTRASCSPSPVLITFLENIGGWYVTLSSGGCQLLPGRYSHPHPYLQVCTICNRRRGACIECSDRLCVKNFHIMCAQRRGLYVSCTNGKKTAFCRRHTLVCVLSPLPCTLRLGSR